MANKDLELKLKLTADGKILVNEVKKGSSVVEEFAKNADGATNTVSTLDGVVGDLVGTLGGLATVAGFGYLAGEILAVNREMEALRTQLISIDGSADRAASTFQKLQEFATQTPFQLQELTQTYIRLKSFGLEPTEKVMLSITEQASKLGGSSETLEGITLALGQAWAKGKLQGEEILQLIERGVPVWSLLEEVTGKNSEQLQKMSSNGELTRDVMSQLIDKIGEMASGSNANAMDTMNGKFSNLADSWTRFQDALLGGQAEDAIKSIVSNFTKELDILTSYLDDGLDAEIRRTEARIKNFESMGAVGRALADYTGYDIGLEQRRLEILNKQKKVRDEERANVDKTKQNLPSIAPTEQSNTSIKNIGPNDQEKESLRQAAQLIDQTRTPLERLNQEIDQYKKLLDAGLISQEVYSRALNDAGEKYNKLTNSSARLTESQRQAAQIINEIKTPLELFNEELALYTRLADEGLLSTDQLATALNNAGKEYNGLPKKVKEANDEMDSFSQSASKGLQDGFETFLFDPFGDGLDGMLKGFADMLKKMAVEQASSAIFGEGGMDFGGIIKGAGRGALDFLGGLFHEGGIVGQGGGTIAVNPMVFAGAPRFHTGGFPGLKSNEVPAILEKGEEVITRNDPRNRLNGSSSGNPVVVNNHFTIQGTPSRKTEQQIANSAGAGIRNAMQRMS